jgi:hypothetical protein
VPRRLSPASLYPRVRGTVIVPLSVHGLPERIDALGEAWERKRELHVTAINTEWLAERLARPVDDVWPEIDAALEGRRAGPVRVRDELRVVRRGEERTIIAMAGVDGLRELYEELSARLGAALELPPTHITLYTRPGGEGIGIHDGRELAQLTRRLAGDEEREVRDAIGDF